MTLETYLKRQGLNPSQFAALMGKPSSTITRLLNGQREPGLSLMREIAIATDWKVKPNDFLPEVRR